ncbi:MAG TPA: YceI family protein [Solirubrobacteraceae bacterium]|jgi:polyisoprenoid-binding protein YceI|nr:YceI family protein [Solirubrobacteraceae bacterium]
MSTHAADPAARTDATTRWLIDPARSRVEFRTRTFWGMVTVTGRFSRYAGTLSLSDDPAVELVIQADSVDTGNERRDKHLRSAAFFDVERHPYVRFVSERVQLDGERLTVHGHLHAAGRSIPLALNATLRGVDGRLEVQASADADHRGLGMTFSPLGMLRSPSRLTVHGRLSPEVH